MSNSPGASRGRPPSKGGRPAGARGKGGQGQGKPNGGKPGGGKGNQPYKKPEPEDPMVALRTRLAKVLGRLPETQRNVLEYRMGLVDGHPHNLADTARELGLSMHEAKQIEQRAFEHIREAIPIQHLQKFLG